MSELLNITAEARANFGKGYARQARIAGKIPAVIYGHGAEPLHVLLPGKQTTLAVRQSNALLNIDLDGENHVTLVKDIQRHALRQTVDHLDLLTVKKGEKVSVEVFVRIEGEVAPGAKLSLDHPSLLVQAEAVALPDHVVANIAGMEAGTQVLASDLILPAGTELAIEANFVIATIDAIAVEEESAASAE
ncbi:50S ribosomal protein L25/general stress protein Ctc [Paeniglutamicibacter cryotolerans]|uniref:Large ribosomal subunit protein bL25 n=1 Tax=Paeniglutamicibacter cryotolerans TaxID=670079 RepID=A0A839QVF2_9MICC|nr:50S ribosomal protein L25/general stress protein Ctc [Paeniglutamicibacter cryotolerans]MBB2995981.1 large subunit ribosomal protein L25 [Paeniglutamicibacter cryotolerans]